MGNQAQVVDSANEGEMLITFGEGKVRCTPDGFDCGLRPLMREVIISARNRCLDGTGDPPPPIELAELLQTVLENKERDEKRFLTLFGDTYFQLLRTCVAEAKRHSEDPLVETSPSFNHEVNSLVGVLRESLKTLSSAYWKDRQRGREENDIMRGNLSLVVRSLSGITFGPEEVATA